MYIEYFLSRWLWYTWRKCAAKLETDVNENAKAWLPGIYRKRA